MWVTRATSTYEEVENCPECESLEISGELDCIHQHTLSTRWSQSRVWVRVEHEIQLDHIVSSWECFRSSYWFEIVLWFQSTPFWRLIRNLRGVLPSPSPNYLIFWGRLSPSTPTPTPTYWYATIQSIFFSCIVPWFVCRVAGRWLWWCSPSWPRYRCTSTRGHCVAPWDLDVFGRTSWIDVFGLHSGYKSIHSFYPR